MAEGPAAGLVVLDAVAHHPELARWSALHAARADLLIRLGRTLDAATAYRTALQLDPPTAERTFIHRQLARLDHHTATAPRCARPPSGPRGGLAPPIA